MDIGTLDLSFLESALTLAREAAAFASPNPTVGCVLVRDGAVLGAGAHRYDAYDHAEIVALKQAASMGLDPRDATAYVTLEPCSHHGRTGPCADALTRAGIARCVIATVDPNPRVRGAGIAKMRAAGITVDVVETSHSLAKQARRLNDAFAFSIQHARPFVTLKAAISLDGNLAPAQHFRTARTPAWLTGTAARADVQHLRHASDAILTGIGTVLSDDPSLTDRSGLARRRKLLRVVLDSALRTPLDAKIVRSADNDVLLVASMTAPAQNERRLTACGASVLRLVSKAQGELDLRVLCDDLHSRGIRSLMLECGSALNGAWLTAGLVDRVLLYVADVKLGDDAVPFAQGETSANALRNSLMKIQQTTFSREVSEADDVRVAGYLHDPWSDLSSSL
jgi:diaminohydroxyphosphoribosylaminopyrimidine deaminase/5-amino-6-(5-phosphoribosylamino)uracil reductase